MTTSSKSAVKRKSSPPSTPTLISAVASVGITTNNIKLIVYFVACALPALATMEVGLSTCLATSSQWPTKATTNAATTAVMKMNTEVRRRKADAIEETKVLLG